VAEPGFRECLLYDFSATARFKHVCTEIAAETAGATNACELAH